MSRITLKALTPSLRPLIYVSNKTTLSEALTIMELEGVSRLPIIDGKGKTLRGILRRKLVFQLQLRKQLPPLDTPMRTLINTHPSTKAPQAVDIEAGLFESMTKFQGADEILVTHKGIHKHLLTAKGLAQWWAMYAQPFVTVEALENTLRQTLQPFEGDQLQQATLPPSAPPTGSAAVGIALTSKLNPIHYHWAFQRLWDELPFADLNRDNVLKRLQEFAEFRNQLMHFRLMSDTAELQADNKETLKKLGFLQDALQARLNQPLSH